MKRLTVEELQNVLNSTGMGVCPSPLVPTSDVCDIDPAIEDCPDAVKNFAFVDVHGRGITLGGIHKFKILRMCEQDGAIVTVPMLAGIDCETFQTGSYIFVQQRGLEPVEIVASAGVTILVPGGLSNKTRAYGSIIELFCESAELNKWILSGDLGRVSLAGDPGDIGFPLKGDPGEVEEAPKDGKPYVRKDGDWYKQSEVSVDAFMINMRLAELDTEPAKAEARANLGLGIIDGGVFN